jgi:hypothetical protein
MRTVYSVAALTPALLIWGGLQQPAKAYNPVAQDVSVDQLYSQLQQSVCQNDWNGALNAVEPMIGSTSITSAYREQLVNLRRQIENWRAAGAYYTGFAECGREVVFSQSARQTSATYIQAVGDQSQDIAVQQLYLALREAVCQNDWDGAIGAIAPLIGSTSITPAYRQQLVGFRRQLEDWRAARSTFSQGGSCSNVANYTPAPEQVAPVAWSAM